MKTIDIILKEAGYTKEFLLECRASGRTNGMGGKGGIQWTDKLRTLKYFNSKEEQELLDDLDLVSDIHDLKFENKNSKNIRESIKRFLKANYDLIIRILRLLHWTSIFGRTTIFCLAFFGLNIFGIKYFNFTKG